MPQPTLEEFVEARVSACTHVMIVRNGKEPVLEAITHISPEQIAFMRQVWTKQYYSEQARASGKVLQHRHDIARRKKQRDPVGIARRAGAL